MEKKEIEQFKKLIITHEEWLMKRVLTYAEENDFTRYTSTLMEAWRVSIEKLSDSLLGLMDISDPVPELRPDEDYTKDPAAEFGMLEAQRHRSRGVNLAMFLALFKYYRQSYHDLLKQEKSLFDSTDYFSHYIERFFDRVEIAFCSEWSGLGSEKQIQELSRTNMRMTNEKNKYLTIFDSVATPVVVIDQEGYVENFNLAAEEVFFEKAVAGERYYKENKVKEKFKWLESELDEFIASKECAHRFEKGYERLNLVFDVKIQKLHDVSKKFVGFTVLMNDITQMKQAEHLKELDRLKTLFIASMSHELRTPLNAIIGFSGILKSGMAGELNEKQKGYSERIHKAGRNLLAMIVDVIDISKLESGNLPFIAGNFSLKEILEELIGENEENFRKKGMEIRLLIDEDIYLCIDRTRLKQSIGNYLSNALKFSEKGSVSIGVRRNENDVEIEVTDEGIGIEKNDIEKIFKPFERLESRLKILAGGAGLGLYLTKKMVTELMGGEVYVKSIPEQGSTFGLRIPVECRSAIKGKNNNV